MKTTLVKIHSYADSHHRVGKINGEHLLLACAYVCAAVFHLEIALALAYMCAACLCFFAKKEV